MLKIIAANNSIPYSWPVDPTAEFQGGYIGQLKVLGNQIVCGVSDGIAPIGIIDDIKINAFTGVSIDEVITVPVKKSITVSGQLVSAYEIKAELKQANIVFDSFVSSHIDVALIPTNGVIVFLAGTPLNYSSAQNGVLDSFRTVVSYTYFRPNIPGEDSTLGTGRVTVWTNRIIAQTDQFDTSIKYPLNASLFANEKGLLTVKRLAPNYPGIAIVTAPPTSIGGLLEFMLI